MRPSILFQSYNGVALCAPGSTTPGCHCTTQVSLPKDESGNPWQWTPRTTLALAPLPVVIAEPPVMTSKALAELLL